jgi:serine/threonine-protein kinase
MTKVLEVGLTPGDRIGNYRVERELGASGSGVLIQAHHLVLPRKAILKVIHPAFAGIQAHALQTLREACILEAIAHPGVPFIYESGVLKDRRPWFAFEAVGGVTLEELFASGPASVPDVIGLARDLADILDHAHGRGVIHRALRPDRVVVAVGRHHPLCIPDWSKAIAHDATSQLPDIAPDGPGAYIAPELARSGARGARNLVDDRVDMFALGVLAYRALTGSLPAAAARDAALHIAAVELRPDAPRELVSIICSLLAENRFDRPSASELRTNLDWLLNEPSALQSEPAVEPLRWRRPRWTPFVGRLDTTDVDISVAEDEPATQ